MLFREIIAVYCENHVGLCGQSAEFVNVNEDGRNWKEYSASMSSNISKWDI
jgi:hypothetical protein